MFIAAAGVAPGRQEREAFLELHGRCFFPRHFLVQHVEHQLASLRHDVGHGERARRDASWRRSPSAAVGDHDEANVDGDGLRGQGELEQPEHVVLADVRAGPVIVSWTTCPYAICAPLAGFCAITDSRVRPLGGLLHGEREGNVVAGQLLDGLL